jgi:hypothetical protein
VELKGKEFEIELDETPYRHEDEEYDVYKERQKMVESFRKMEVKNNFHDSISFVDKMVGRKGITYLKEKTNGK